MSSAETVKSPRRLVDKVTQTPALPNMAASMSETDHAETTSSYDITNITSLEWQQLKELADLAFLELAKRKGIDSNPADFASLAVEGMKRLQEKKKGNLIYKFAMCIGKNQPGTQQSLFPLDRMPFGLVEYQIEFFSATNIMGVSFAVIIISQFHGIWRTLISHVLLFFFTLITKAKHTFSCCHLINTKAGRNFTVKTSNINIACVVV